MVFAPIEMTSANYSLSMNLMLCAFKKPFWFNHQHQSLTTTSSILLILWLLLLFLCIIRHHILTSTSPPLFLVLWYESSFNVGLLLFVYFSPSHPIYYDNLHDLISQLPSPLMIVGDFNCRHTLLGDSVVNFRGRSLERYLSASSLSILNLDHLTHFDTRIQSFSCLDLSICTPPLNLYFYWSVLVQYSLLSPTSYFPIPNPPRWCF